MREENGKVYSRKLLISDDDIGKRAVATLVDGCKLRSYLSGESGPAIELEGEKNGFE